MLSDKELIKAKRMMQYTLLMESITHNIGYYYALQKDMTRTFLGDLLYRQRFGKNYIVSLFGKTGSGKSMASADIAEKTTTNFSPSRMKFTDDEVLQELNDVPPQTTVIKDEQIGMVGEGSGQQEIAVENIEATVRCLQANLIYNSPSLKLHHSHYSAEIFFDWHETKRLTALWLYNGNDIQNPLGIIITGMPKADMTDYQRRKHDFASRVKSQDVGTNAVSIRNMERFLTSHWCGALKSMKEVKAVLKSDNETFDANLTIGQIDTICSLIAVKSREEGIKIFIDEEKRKKIEEKLTKNPRTKNLFKMGGFGKF